MATRTYVVGGSRGVRRLDDLTLPWQSVNLDVTPTDQAIDLWDVMTDPNDPNKVFVVGQRFVDQGLYGLYYSTDGGVNWQQPTGGHITTTACLTNIFIEVWVVDSNTIYICGDRSNVLKSTDGGVTFNLTGTAPGGAYNVTRRNVSAIHFPDALNGVVCHDDTTISKQFISVTDDGGASWTTTDVTGLFAPVIPDNGRGLGVHMSADYQTIVALHEEAILRSTDNGATWNWVSQPNITEALFRHLSWVDDSNLWAYGTLGLRYKSADAGLTWSTLSTPVVGQPTHLAGHNYNLTDGFYSEDSEVYETSDSAATGLLSDITNSNPPLDKQFTTVRAIWTDFELPTSQPCGCPEGYTYNFDTDLCEQEQETAPKCDEPLCSVVLAGCCQNIFADLLYGRYGAYFYEDATSKPWPISEVSTTDPNFIDALEDSSGSVLALDTSVGGVGPGVTPPGVVRNLLWGGSESQKCADSRLSAVGVWTTPNNCTQAENNNPLNQWIGFTACIDVPVTATYSIGFGGDNYVRITIDGDLFAIINVSEFSAEAWHVIPLTLSAGSHNIVIEGYNLNRQASLGAEIYSTTPSVLSTITSEPALLPYVVWSTADRVGTTFDLAGAPDGGAGEVCGGCECPEGYTMSNCNGQLVCVRTDQVPFEPCNCYLATNCEDPEDTQLVSIDSTLDPLDLSLIYVFDFDLTKCWTIEESLDCPFDNPISTVSASYESCELCLGVCYKLTDCESGEITYVNNVAYAEYVGNTIRVNYEVSQGVFEIRCYTVEEVQCPDVTIPSIGEILDCFDNCQDCLPKPVTPVLDIKNRTVKPGYDTPACTPAYYDKVSCKFADAMYVKMSKTRFGIQFDCHDDEDKWVIKYELLQLKSIETEDACTTISNPCCPPCNVVAELTPPTFPCEPPTNLTADLIVPAPKNCQQITFVGYSVYTVKPPGASFTDCNGDTFVLKIVKIEGVDRLFINSVDSGPWPDVGVTYCIDLLQPYMNDGFIYATPVPC